MEKRMETTIVYGGFIGIMEKKIGVIGFRDLGFSFPHINGPFRVWVLGFGV